MSKLDDLIAKLCPDGVEYVTLGEICELSAGGDLPKDKFSKDLTDEYSVPIYSNGIDDNALYGYTDIAKITKPCITIAARGTIGYCALRKTPFFPIIRLICAIPHDSMSVDFLYYCIQKIRFQVPLSGIPQLTVPMVAKYMVPLPPLPVQQEIVRILDKFTELEAELEAELVARTKQYEYYRDNILLDTNSNYKQQKIGDVCLRTENIDWSKTNDLVFKYIDLTSVDRDTHTINETNEINSDTAPSRAQKFVITDDIIFGTTRPTLKRVCIIPQEYNRQICSTGFCVLRADRTKVLPKFLYHHISETRYYDYIERMQQGSAYPSVSDIDVKNFEIPVPPLAEQERIVAILDRFDSLVNDITTGLPAEIAARRKQYEYYRDKLLTFREKAS